MGRRTEFDHQKLPRIVETDRYRMLSKPCTDKHRAFAALESAAAIRRKKEILRAGQPVILAKAQDSPMIMSGQNKVRTPGKIRISIFRVMCQKNMYPRHERCPEKFFQLCETEFWRIRFVIIFDWKFQSVKDKISSTKIRRYALISVRRIAFACVQTVFKTASL